MAYQRSQAGDACVTGCPRAEGHHATSAVALERVWAEANWSARAALGPHGQISAYHHRGVWLIEVDGDYSDIAQEVDHSIQLSLAESPRGVVVSMLHPPGEAENGSLLDSLASAGRHVRRWPGAPIVIVCRDSHTLAALNSRPEGRYLGHSSSLLRAWSQILTHDPSPTARAGTIEIGHLAAPPRNPATLLNNHALIRPKRNSTANGFACAIQMGGIASRPIDGPAVIEKSMPQFLSLI